MEKQIGDRIAEERKKLKLTQSELAEKLMVSNKAVSKWESGVGCPSLEFLPKLAELFGCTLDYLIMGKTNEDLFLDFEMEKFFRLNNVCVRAVQEYFNIGYSKGAELVDELSKHGYTVWSEEEDHFVFENTKKSEIKKFLLSYFRKV